jgi:hypothetical protein
LQEGIFCFTSVYLIDAQGQLALALSALLISVGIKSLNAWSASGENDLLHAQGIKNLSLSSKEVISGVRAFLRCDFLRYCDM